LNYGDFTSSIINFGAAQAMFIFASAYINIACVIL